MHRFLFRTNVTFHHFINIINRRCDSLLSLFFPFAVCSGFASNEIGVCHMNSLINPKCVPKRWLKVSIWYCQLLLKLRFMAFCCWFWGFFQKLFPHSFFLIVIWIHWTIYLYIIAFAHSCVVFDSLQINVHLKKNTQMLKYSIFEGSDIQSSTNFISINILTIDLIRKRSKMMQFNRIKESLCICVNWNWSVVVSNQSLFFLFWHIRSNV